MVLAGCRIGSVYPSLYVRKRGVWFDFVGIHFASACVIPLVLFLATIDGIRFTVLIILFTMIAFSKLVKTTRSIASNNSCHGYLDLLS